VANSLRLYLRAAAMNLLVRLRRFVAHRGDEDIKNGSGCDVTLEDASAFIFAVNPAGSSTQHSSMSCVNLTIDNTGANCTPVCYTNGAGGAGQSHTYFSVLSWSGTKTGSFGNAMSFLGTNAHPCTGGTDWTVTWLTTSLQLSGTT
jgi:hypothetical protein